MGQWIHREKSHPAGKDAGQLPPGSTFGVWLERQTGASWRQLCQVSGRIRIAEVVVCKPEFFIRCMGCQGIKIPDQILGKLTAGEKRTRVRGAAGILVEETFEAMVEGTSETLLEDPSVITLEETEASWPGSL